MKKLTLFVWLTLFLAVFLVYYPVLFTFFAQDDFTHFLISQAHSLGDVLRFFLPLKTSIFYRPLSVQLVTWVMRSIFGLNPFAFHLLALLIHLVNSLLIYKLLLLLLKHKPKAYIGALIYGVHPVHFMSLFWTAEFSMVLAPCFAFLAMLFFLRKRYMWFLVCLSLGLLSNELVSMVPLVLWGRALLQKNKRAIPWLICASVLASMLWIIRFIVVPASLGSEYILSFRLSTFVANFKWQLLRSSGLTEGFLAYTHWWAIRLSVGAVMLFWIWWGIYAIKNRKISSSVWLVAGWGLWWYVVSLLPVMFLAHHQSPLYQIIGLPGLMVALLAPVSVAEKSLFPGLLGGLFFVSSFWAVRAMNQYHWVTQRARLAAYHITKLRLHPPKADESIVFLNTTEYSSTQVYMALAGDHALKVFFGNNPVVFEDFQPVAFSDKTVYMWSRVESQTQ